MERLNTDIDKPFVYRLEVEELCWLLGFWWQYLDVLESSLL